MLVGRRVYISIFVLWAGPRCIIQAEAHAADIEQIAKDWKLDLNSRKGLMPRKLTWFTKKWEAQQGIGDEPNVETIICVYR